MEHQVKFGSGFMSEMKDLDDAVIKKLFINFIAPIRNGLTPPEDLEGKYKPSWEMPFANSIMKQAFITETKKHNLHHYHFGYSFYKDGKDPKYDGSVSDGIIHTRIEVDVAETRHVITDLCLKHPSPFKIPFETAFDDVA